MSSDEEGVTLQRLEKRPQCVESQQPRVPEETALKGATTGPTTSVIRVYKRRWLMLGLYVAVICLNSVPYMQYTVVADVLKDYYRRSKDDLEWMTMVSSATATLFIFPSAWVLDKYGLRVSVLLGAGLTASGLWLKTLGCGEDGFALAMAGQALVSVATLFVVSSAPPRMAAVWFPAHQVASAVGAAYLVIMLGIAIGCGMAPLTVHGDPTAPVSDTALSGNVSNCHVVRNATEVESGSLDAGDTYNLLSPETKEEIYYGLLSVNIALAVVGTLLLAAVYFVFQEKPPLPPSPSQAVRSGGKGANNAMAFLHSLRRIGRDPYFLLLLFACALFSSTLIAFSVLMNRTVVHFFPDAFTQSFHFLCREKCDVKGKLWRSNLLVVTLCLLAASQCNGSDTGYIGMIMTLVGIVGIVVVSIIVDKTRLFKEWAVVIYTCALLGAVAYSVSVSKGTMLTVYLSSCILGFFMPCFYVPGLALAVELTYPEPEGNPTAIINWLIQPTALVVKLVYSQLFEAASPDVAHMVQCSLLVAGLVCISCVPKKYKRREAERLAQSGPTKETNGSAAGTSPSDPEAAKLNVVV